MRLAWMKMRMRTMSFRGRPSTDLDASTHEGSGPACPILLAGPLAESTMRGQGKAPKEDVRKMTDLQHV